MIKSIFYYYIIHNQFIISSVHFAHLKYIYLTEGALYILNINPLPCICILIFSQSVACPIHCILNTFLLIISKIQLVLHQVLEVLWKLFEECEHHISWGFQDRSFSGQSSGTKLLLKPSEPCRSFCLSKATSSWPGIFNENLYFGPWLISLRV